MDLCWAINSYGYKTENLIPFECTKGHSDDVPKLTGFRRE